MAINWQYNEKDYSEKNFTPIPVGDHKVRIADAEETTSKASGNKMIKLSLDISAYSGRLWDYIVFDPQNPQMTNQKLGSVFASFGITPGNLKTSEWLGKVGAVKVKHEIYNGEPNPKVSYYLTKDKQKNLSPWQEPNRPKQEFAPSTIPDEQLRKDGFTPVDDDDLPF
jgi:hypothetical protein